MGFTKLLFNSFSVSMGPISFGLFTFLCVLSAPIALLKTVISLIQLFAACQNVVSLDVAERNAEKKLK